MENPTTALQPTGLLCELMEHPESAKISNPNPRFSWIVNDSSPGAHQSTYQIIVASSIDKLADDNADMWDSGEIDPGREWTTINKSIHVQYEGKPLKPHATHYWKVRTWNRERSPGPYSEPQAFNTGELSVEQGEYSTARCAVEVHKTEPERVVRTGKNSTFIDFGKATFATVQLTLTSPTEGLEIDIHLGEVSEGNFAIDRNPGGSRRYRRIPLKLKNGKHSYILRIPPDERNTGSEAILMPEHIGEVMPFRYCEITGYPFPILRSDVCRHAAWYPFDDEASEFVSSNTVLNDVWEMCKYSMKVTNFCGVYVDGDRERIPYEADTYIHQLGHYCCDRDYALARYSHEYLITHPTWPTEWIIFSILIAWEDFMQTGDPSSLEHYYQDLQAKTLEALARDDGLISVETGKVTEEILESIHFNGELRNIVDWPECERDGYEMVPVNTVVNAFYYHGLVLMSRIAGVLGKEADADSYRKKSFKVRDSIHEKLINAEKGLFVDGEGSRHCSIHANMFTLRFGLVPENCRHKVISFIKSRGMACSVYGSQILLDALFQEDEDDYALSLLTSSAERSWAHMIYDVGSTITMEAWDNRYKPNQGWNHAWGAVPANIMPRRLMGIRALEPGFGRIIIQPKPGSLAFARMIMPTIRGPVCVSFNSSESGSFYLEVEIPANTTARIMIPQKGSKTSHAVVDGKPIQGVIEGNYLVFDPLEPGKHTIYKNSLL